MLNTLFSHLLGAGGGAIGVFEGMMGNVLSENARRFVVLADRMMRVYSVLGLDPLERAIIVVLINDPGPWGISALAQYIGYNRSTVYRRLILRERQGLVHRIHGMWTLTEFGAESAARVMNEVSGLVFGELPRLSDDVINLCARICRGARPAEARLLSFRGSKI